jgi:hypothetical protein
MLSLIFIVAMMGAVLAIIYSTWVGVHATNIQIIETDFLCIVKICSIFIDIIWCAAEVVNSLHLDFKMCSKVLSDIRYVREQHTIC